MRRYAWITSILSPWPQYSLSTACISTESVCVSCLCSVCLPLTPAVLPLPLSLLIMSADQFITCTDLYRHRLLVWRHWTERGSIVVHQWWDIYCILKKKPSRDKIELMSWLVSIIIEANSWCFEHSLFQVHRSGTVAERKYLCSSIRYGLLNPCALNPLIQRVIIVIIISCTFDEIKCYDELDEWGWGCSL